MKKLVCILSILISFSLIGLSGFTPEEKIKLVKLELVRKFPLEEQEVFFKTTPKIALDSSGNVYAMDNMQHTFFKFDRYGNFLKKIGRRGQGPGELEFPFLISLGENKVFISDNKGISIFDLDGKFINGFRKFRFTRSMAVFKDKVLLSESNTNNLIAVYSHSGKKLNSFGEIYKINYSILTDWQRYRVENVINWGEIVCSNNYIFFVSALFGDIYKYDSNGNLIKKKRIKNIDFLEDNKKFYFKTTTIKKWRNKSLPLRLYFQSAVYFENKIYLLLIDKNIYGEIWKLDKDKLEVEKKYSFFNFRETLPTQIRSRNIGINKRNDDNILNFYISFISEGEHFINVYTSKMK